MKKRFAIVGAGLTGLSAAYFLRREFPDAEISVFDSDERVGGKIRSHREGDFPHERGPNGFLSSRKPIFNLCKELGLEIRNADHNAAIRYLWLKSCLMKLPSGPGSLMGFKGLGLKSKLSLLGDLLKKPRPSDDESIYDFVKAQFSEEMAQNMADPFVSGVFAADCRKLSMRSAFPTIFNAQREHGSIIKGMKALKREREEREGKASKREAGYLCNLNGGMEALPKALAERAGDDLKSGVKIDQITCEQGHVDLKMGELEGRFDAVIMATPAPESAKVLQEGVPRVAELMGQIEYTPVGVVVCGFKKKLDMPKGFGFLVPSQEKSDVLGVLFSSQIFPDNHNREGTTLRAMFGGSHKGELLKASDEEIRKMIEHELSEKLGLNEEIDYFHVVRWHKAIPLYALGHYKRVEEIELALREKPLFVTGTALYGVSMNDCVVSAQDCVNQVVAYMRSKHE